MSSEESTPGDRVETRSPASGSTAPGQGMRESFRAQPVWKKSALIGAAVCCVVGLALLGLESSPEDSAGLETAASRGAGGASPGGAASGLRTSLVDPGVLPPDGSARVEPPPPDESNWAPVFLRFGFSFFVGFAIGSAIRMVLKLALIFIGGFAVLLMGLESFGFVAVQWDVMGQAFDDLVAKIGEESGSVKGFLTGRLPSAGLGVFGLYAGFRRG